jgi:Uncharacterized alpha/beta hydrolase domain (DUF2235)
MDCAGVMTLFPMEVPVKRLGRWSPALVTLWIARAAGRHAVSLDERRCFFDVNLWGTSDPDQHIKQVWFTGVHSDVGGSYPEKESGLSKVALEWMLVEAMKAGLKVDPDKANVVLGRKAKPSPWMPDYVEPNPTAKKHESLHGLWWLPEFLPHRYMDMKSGSPIARYRIPMGRNRAIPEGSVIHESVFKPEQRIADDRLPRYYTIEPSCPFSSVMQIGKGE